MNALPGWFDVRTRGALDRRDTARIRGSLIALAAFQARNGSAFRGDASGVPVTDRDVAAFAAEHVTARYDSVAGDGRYDSFDAGQGIALARDLEVAYREVMEEEFEAPVMFGMFPVDTSIAPGARFYRLYRMSETAEVAWYRGSGSNVPRVGLTRSSEARNIANAVTSFPVNYFDRESAEFARIPYVSKGLRTIRSGILDFLDDALLDGAPEVGLYGLLDYPYMDKVYLAPKFDGSATTDADKAAIVAAVLRLANHVETKAHGTKQINRLAMGTRGYQYVTQTRFNDGTGDTLAKRILESLPEVSTIEKVSKLQARGPGGTDVIVAWRDGERGPQIIMPRMVTYLPAQVDGFDEVTNGFASCGGIVCPYVGQVVLGYVDAG